MDSYIITKSLTVHWINYGASPSDQEALYFVDVDVEQDKIDNVLGTGKSPHSYWLYDAERKPVEIQVGNFRVLGSVLHEKLLTNYNRELVLSISDDQGDIEKRSYTFSGVHNGDFVHKIPEVLNLLKELNQYNNWKEITALKKLEAENKALSKTIDELQDKLANAESQNEELRTDIAALKSEINDLKKQIDQSAETIDPLPAAPQDDDAIAPPPPLDKV